MLLGENMMSRPRPSRVLSLLLALPLLGPSVALAAPRPVVSWLLAPPLEGQINANTATVDQWDLLPGIGPATAQRIVDYVRKRPLRHPSHVQRVKGIGRKTYNKIKAYLVLEGDTTLRVAEPDSGR